MRIPGPAHQEQGGGQKSPSKPHPSVTIDGVTCPVVPQSELGGRDIYCVSYPSSPGHATAAGITINDVARFAPSPGRLVMEPNGWAVVGVDSNFYATVGQQTKAGTLLNSAVRVRFTPVAFRWSYGDGAVRSTGVAGSSWAAAGVREFQATPTGHRYMTAGDYIARLTVSLRADYTFGGSTWARVPGTLDLATAPARVHVATADTVLVAHPCTAASDGPGC